MADTPLHPARPRPKLIGGERQVSGKADVLVIGGGPAGCWAAISAAESGSTVFLVDKGYCGTTGAAASAGVNVWYVDPDAQAREHAMQDREALGGWLVDRNWMGRVLEETYAQMGRLAEWGYPFPVREDGEQARTSLQGPEYQRRMRKQVARAGVTILDHSPAIELLRDPDGAVAGAAGVRRQRGDRWVIRARSVIVATGGCSFRSGGIGCDVLTGDGHLMAAELGAELSGMEFSNAYAISPTFASVTKTALYHWATFYHEDGRILEGAGSQKGRSVIAQALAHEQVYAQLDRAPAPLQTEMRAAQPNFFVPFDRMGIDPFRQRFPVTLRLEGTIRGTGGLRVTDERCATTVRGLYAAGDAATRELICGGFTGGGSHNAAWAISSGIWAGRGAAAHANRADAVAERPEGAGGAGLRPTAMRDATLDWREITRSVQAEVQPYDKNYFRAAPRLRDSLATLDTAWAQVRGGLGGGEEDVVRRRESVAMLAHARWMYSSALDRSETRGMHKRVDRPELDPGQWHRKLVGGLDEVWTAVDPLAPVSTPVAAAGASVV
jgi:succinate dehydrogenase/fumarate reductase flavoprotein subunit